MGITQVACRGRDHGYCVPEFTPLTLPVLSLDAEVVLPGMVVPLDLSESDVRAAVDAARAAAHRGDKPRVLLVPRVDGEYADIGVLGRVEQVGRLADGDPGALIRGLRRVRIGAGTTGPGTALWVEGTEIDESVPDPLPGAVTELIKEYKALITDWLRKRGAWQVVDRVQQIDDVSQLADNAGYSPFLSTEQKVDAAGDRRPRRAAQGSPPRRCASTWPSRMSPSPSPRTSRRASTSSSASSCCAARWRPSARSWRS